MKDLKKYSPITFIFERIFYLLQYLSISNLLLKTRVKIQNEFFQDQANREKITQQRGRNIEIYVLIITILVISDAILLNMNLCQSHLVFIILPIYRIFEIFVVTINLNIFDRLRIKKRKHYVSGITRTIILSIWNYLELLLAFAIVYNVFIDQLNGASTFFDSFYFSVITQLTIGYGDIKPVGNLRIIPIIQGIIGLFFMLIIISRFIALLPKVETIQKDDK